MSRRSGSAQVRPRRHREHLASRRRDVLEIDVEVDRSVAVAAGARARMPSVERKKAHEPDRHGVLRHGNRCRFSRRAAQRSQDIATRKPGIIGHRGRCGFCWRGAIGVESPQTSFPGPRRRSCPILPPFDTPSTVAATGRRCPPPRSLVPDGRRTWRQSVVVVIIRLERRPRPRSAGHTSSPVMASAA